MSEVKKPRARKAKAGKGAVANPAASLIAGLKFIAPAQKKVGSIGQQFCSIWGNWIAASNDVLTIGVKVEDDLQACPHSFQLLDALSKVSGSVEITQLDERTLVISSGLFRALVPCVPNSDLAISPPDARIGQIGDSLKVSFGAVAGLATEGAQHAFLASVLLQAGSVVSTDQKAILEHWHGWNVPSGLMVPKAAAVAVSKVDKPLAGFGFSHNSFTFWFEDESFIKTQLFNRAEHQFPNYLPELECEGMNPWPIPDNFFKAVKAVASFSKTGTIWFEDTLLASTQIENQASTFKVEGLPAGMGFNAELLLSLESHFQKVHFDVNVNCAFFFGEGVRGRINGVEGAFFFGEGVRGRINGVEGASKDVAF